MSHAAHIKIVAAVSSTILMGHLHNVESASLNTPGD
jgi:hypothetical protein